MPGATYHLTRRCTQRQFLLRPCETVNEVFLFVLAVAARKTGVLVHAYCVMSNHVHLLVTDPHARLPEFHQYLDAFVARAMNAVMGRRESFWAPGSFTATRVVSPEDVVQTAAYLLANPVAAGLVRTGRIWPGLWSDPERFGTTIDVKRPRYFFSRRSAVVATEQLELAIPPGFASAAEFSERVEAAWLDKEAQVRIGKTFLGLAAVLKQDPFGRPASLEPRRSLKPRVAARATSRRIEALRELKAFFCEYRDALAEWRAGKRDIVFPAGTYLLRVAHGVQCAGFG